MRPRFTISKISRGYYAVYDSHAVETAAYPVALRCSRRACENYIKETWRYIRKERQAARRRMAKEINR